MRSVCTVAGLVLLLAGASTVAMAAPAVAPEIDPASAGSAITLVSGMLLMFGGRRK